MNPSGGHSLLLRPQRNQGVHAGGAPRRLVAGSKRHHTPHRSELRQNQKIEVRDSISTSSTGFAAARSLAF